MSHISCKCQRNSCEGPIPRGGRPDNNGGQFINKSVTKPLPNLWPMSAAQRHQWHSSWPLVLRFLWEAPSPRSIRGMDINLPLLANSGLFTTGTINHEENKDQVGFFWGETDTSGTIEDVNIKPPENETSWVIDPECTECGTSVACTPKLTKFSLKLCRIKQPISSFSVGMQPETKAASSRWRQASVIKWAWLLPLMSQCFLHDDNLAKYYSIFFLCLEILELTE